MANSQSPVIVWFRRDLRLADNPALTAAAKTDAPLLPLYILDDETPGDLRMGGASRWWLHGSLKALDESLGGKLCLRMGRAADVLGAVLDETGAGAVHIAKAYDPWDAGLEETVARLCEAKGAGLHLHPGQLLFAPGEIVAGSGKPYRVFTPFWKACLAAPAPRAPSKAPRLGAFARAKSLSLDSLGLLPTMPDWAGGLRETWQPGEDAAKERLSDFIDSGLRAYATSRDSFGDDATSHLSPYLHFGEISPSQVWHTVRHAAHAVPGKSQGAEAFLRQIGWREFSYHLLYRFPEMPEKPLRPEFADFPWREDRQALRAWQRG
ncbi:MAG: cryptochrome/photolyase family protein, partial [Methyloceanibacter sp.]|uniref:cryptochrome/photolyase family protein n=1 Tax=Methyloceanibacter sp. TaxID=1965321 RepID=UPI003EDF426A